MLKIINSANETVEILQNVVSPIISEGINREFTFDFTTIIDNDKSNYVNYQNKVEVEDNYFNIVYTEEERTQDGLYIKAQCEHVSYDLISANLTSGFTATGVFSAVATLLFAGTPFTVGTAQVTASISVNITESTNKRSVLMQLATLYGGELKFDKYAISLLTQRGADRGAQFRYRKNLVGVKKITDARQSVAGVPRRSYDVSVAELEFEQSYIADGVDSFEHYELGDTVTVIDEDLGLNTPLRIVKESHDVNQRMQGQVEIGNFVDDLASTLSNMQSSIIIVDNNYSSWNSTATNFDTRNDRISTTPADPVISASGSAVDHVINTDGSADISLEWAFTGAGDAYDIDGFVVLLRSSTSSAAYTFGTTPSEEHVTYATKDKLAAIFEGVPADKYYTFGVKAYRMVDQDINAAGIIYSNVVQPSLAAENPYRPSANVAFAGNIIGTINSVAVGTVTSATDLLNNVVANERLGAQVAGFTANSVRYKQDFTQVLANLPRYETGKFGQSTMFEEVTTDLFTAAESQGTFSWDSYTKLLLHMDGISGSTTFTDEIGKTVTANGNAQIDTAQSVFGGACGLFDGSGDYLSIPNHADFAFGTGDFTIDFRVRYAAGSAYQTIYDYGYVSAGALLLQTDNGATPKMQVYINGSLVVADSTGAELNIWYHYEIGRNGTTVYIRRAGVLTGSDIDSTNITNVANLGIGAMLSTGLYSLNGWLDEFRVSKGIARHTADFTPPTAAYVPSSIQSLATATYTVAVNAGAGSIALSGVSTATATLGSPVTFTLTATTTVAFTPTGTVTKCQLEAKAYATSWQIGGTARAAEVMVVPNAGNFTKGNAAVELTYIPKIDDKASKAGILWTNYIDANNYYLVRKDITTGYLSAHVVSGGTDYSITGNSALAVDSENSIMFAINGTNMRLCNNGVQIGADTAYTEPVGTLPTFMYFMSDQAGANQGNGLLDDMRASLTSRTVVEHQTYYASGDPLSVDENTGIKMDFDSTLRQTTRNHAGRPQGTFMIADNDTTYDKSRATHIIPTGWTNAQVVFNQAISELPATGGQINGMDGTAIVDDCIILPSNVTLDLTTMTLKVKDSFNSTLSLIRNSDTTNGNTNIKIKHGVLDGNKANNATAWEVGILLYKTTNSEVRGTTAKNLKNNGIQLLDYCTGNGITGNSCTNNDADGLGIYSNCEGNTINGNTCSSNGGAGIAVWSGSVGNTVSGNTCNNNTGHGISIWSAANKNTVGSNTCQNNAGYGMNVELSSDNSLTGNTCIYNQGYGIFLHDTSNDNNVIGNTCNENSQGGNAVWSNIEVYENCNRNNIQSNICRRGTGAIQPKYGIRIVGFDSDDNIVTNNDLLTGGSLGGLGDTGTGTVTTAGNRGA